MIHPSYKELIEKINEGVEPGEEPVVTSRFSVVMATSKRARQIIARNQNLPPEEQIQKPLSEAVDELYDGRLKILPELPEDEQEQELNFGLSSMSFDVAQDEEDSEDENSEDVSESGEDDEDDETDSESEEDMDDDDQDDNN